MPVTESERFVSDVFPEMSCGGMRDPQPVFRHALYGALTIAIGDRQEALELATPLTFAIRSRSDLIRS